MVRMPLDGIPRCVHCGVKEGMWHITGCPSEIPQQAPRDPLLVEREKTHGDFRKNGEQWDKLVNALDIANHDIKPEMKLAIAMICLKLSRICSGQPFEKDHWLDIAGYAKLGSESCE